MNSEPLKKVRNSNVTVQNIMDRPPIDWKNINSLLINDFHQKPGIEVTDRNIISSSPLFQKETGPSFR